MRRFWSYIGAMLPLAATTTYAGGSINPYADIGPNRHLRRDDGTESEEEASGGIDGKDASQDGDSGPASAAEHTPSRPSALEGGDDAVTQEIRGLLNELDRMTGSPEVNNPVSPALHGPAASGMYAPATSSGVSGGGGKSLSALANVEDEADTEIESGADDSMTDPETETPSTTEGPSAEGPAEADVEDVDSMLVLLGGTAGGADGTMTDGDIDLEMVDYGEVTVAYGKVEFTATSDWDGTGQPPATYAETFLDVYDADLVFFYHVDDGYASDDGTQYTELSTLYVVAVDFEDDHPLANEFDLSDDNGYQHEFDPGLMLAAYDGTPEAGYFSHPLLDGIPFYAFSQYYSDANGEVHLDDSGSDLSFISTTLDGNDDFVVLVGDVTTVEDVGSTGDLVAQTDHGGLSISVSGYGPDTYASIDGQMLAVDDDFSGITGLAIGIA